MPNKTSKIPFHRTVSGVIFISITAFIISAVVIFAIIFSYYLIRVKFGDTTELEKKFNTHSTNDETTFLSFETEADLTKENLVRPHSPVFGNPEATTKMIMFIDFSCPFCQETYSGFEDVRARYEPAIQFVYKYFTLETEFADGFDTALASACANEQNKFWEYYQLLFENKIFDRQSLLDYASSLELEMDSFQTCLDSEKYRSQIAQDFQDGLNIGVAGTPSYLLNKKLIQGTLTPEKWDEIILPQLQKQL
ncbi:DsbA family protein [Patescibacteria group bacterium]|nr:DsbA family protein [Patescibacteria group bacterium]MBU1895527.1 DsbA family protein [Patescibacteria group bacterium]